MPGNYQRPRTNAAKFLTLTNGTEICVQIEPSIDTAMVASVLARWSWDVLFTSVGIIELSASDPDTLISILKDGAIYNTNAPFGTGPTWADYIDQQLTYVNQAGDACDPGAPSLAGRFYDWLATQTTANVESDVTHWANTWFAPQIQGGLDRIIPTIVPESPPSPPPTVQQEFPPNQIGGLPSGVAIMLGTATRITLAANSAGRVLVGIGPVPT